MTAPLAEAQTPQSSPVRVALTRATQRGRSTSRSHLAEGSDPRSPGLYPRWRGAPKLLRGVKRRLRLKGPYCLCRPRTLSPLGAHGGVRPALQIGIHLVMTESAELPDLQAFTSMLDVAG